MAAPLTQLVEKGGFNCTDDSREAFQRLQQAMMTLPVLALPDFSSTFELEANASGYGIEVVLMQTKKSIAYFSHTLAVRGRVKPVYERELMVWSWLYRGGDRTYSRNHS